MLAGNILYVHKFKFLFPLLDQGLIFSELVAFYLIFASDLRSDQLRVDEDLHPVVSLQGMPRILPDF